VLDRSRAEAASPRSRAIAFAVAACFSLAIGGWLTFAGVDYLVNGCGCHERLFGDWYGPVLIAVAAPFLVAALLISVRAWRALRRRVSPG
jgi:hypothetical protein